MFRHFIVFILALFLNACASTSEPQNLAHIDVEMAVQDMQAQDFLSAKAQLLQALQLDEEDAEVQSAWGYYLFLTGDVGLAKTAYQKALSLAPNDPQIEDDYAVFLYHEAEYQDALKYFLVAAEDPNYLYTALAYQNASLAAGKLGQVDLAKQYADLAVREGM